ncbi:Flp pilus assembly protein TadB [Actinacidiphila cocklensis]|uniref:Flp pilus assembly protein TadB n=1 Tax=Actinacidiphila cocklensis TaxID=887465 RepID=A0A9W4DJF1_9ACTN|nr:Flp pilus assembly protein TadB [Actinacidiphila cocklensis]
MEGGARSRRARRTGRGAVPDRGPPVKARRPGAQVRTVPPRPRDGLG